MIRRRKNITDPKKTMILVCATESETLYFSQMRKDCRYANLTVEKAPKAGNLKEIIDSTAKLKNTGKYEIAWALFGFDDVKTNVDEVLEKQDYATRKKVKLCFFNPSFKLWFALHLQQPKSYQTDISPLVNKVKDLVPDFDLTPSYLRKEGATLHIKFFPKHSVADINARNYNEIVSFDTGLPATTMPLFDMDILEICGQADMSHNHRAR